MEGFVETLPSMILGRMNHGCSSYIQNGKKVILECESVNYCHLLSGSPCDRRMGPTG